MTSDDLAPIFLAKRVGPNYVAKCPAHDDNTASLSFRDDGDRVLMLDRGNCPTETVLAAKGLKLSDLYHESNGHRGGRWVEEDRYEVRDTEGSLQATHRRMRKPDGTKTFVWERPGGEKGLGGRKAESLPLFGAERLKEHQGEVWITEGEKAALAANRAGLFALATVTGAASAPSADVLEALRDREVVLWPDNDAPGRAHMDRIAQRLQGVAKSVSEIRWQEAPEKGDAADFFPTWSKDDAVALVREWKPETREDGWRKPSSLRDLFHDVRRLPTSFKKLNSSWEGGVEVPRLIIPQGPATSGKSGFSVQEVVELVRQGALGVIVPADSGRKPAAIRVAGVLGLDPRVLKDSTNPEWAVEWDRFERLCETLGLWITPDDEAIEEVVARLKKLAIEFPGRVIALAVDSLQTIHTVEQFDTDRARIEHVVRQLTDLRERLPIVMYGVSEVVKGAYRSKKPGENVEPLAAAAETRAISHAADTVLHFSGHPLTEAVIQVPKNREYEARFAFSVQVRDNRLVEVDGAVAAQAREQAQIEKEEKEAAEIADDVLAYLRRLQNQTPPEKAPIKSEIATETVGTTRGRKYQAFVVAMRGLETRKEIRPEGRGWRTADWSLS